VAARAQGLDGQRLVELVRRGDGDDVELLGPEHLVARGVARRDAEAVADLPEALLVYVADRGHPRARVILEAGHVVAPHAQADHADAELLPSAL